MNRSINLNFMVLRRKKIAEGLDTRNIEGESRTDEIKNRLIDLFRSIPQESIPQKRLYNLQSEWGLKFRLTIKKR